MLTTWLRPHSLPDFRAHYLQREAIACPSTALGCKLLDWDIVDRILRQQPDVLVVARGRLLPDPPPASLDELRGLMARGGGLCIRHAEQHDDGLAGLARTFGELGEAQVQLFVTPGGTHGFGWHYDDEDVFIAQTLGRKEYYFRRNTVAADERARPAMFARYQDERSVLCAATLVAGDFLYVPARWWHMAVCAADSLSISVGVRITP